MATQGTGNQGVVPSEQSYAQSKNQGLTGQWYVQNIDKYLVPDTRRLLSDYAHVPEAQQSKHVHDIRDKLWAIRTYPCVGTGVFLMPYIARSPAYEAVLAKLKKGGTFLDVGCFCGADMRQAVFDGAPSAKMVGVDIVSHWEVGFEMFNDRDRFQAKYIEADILKTDDVPELVALRGQVDVINVSAVLHQWTWEGQVQAAKELVKFSKVGTVIVGHQIGGSVAEERVMGPAKVYRQNAQSFRRLWEEVGAETGTSWSCEASQRTWEHLGWDEKDMFWLGEGANVLEFVITRT